MKRYMNKPVVIEAERLTENKRIETPGGWIFGRDGEWLIKGEYGELRLCKDEIFRKMYVPMDEKEKGFSRPFLLLTVDEKNENGELMMPEMDRETKERILAFIVQGFAKNMINDGAAFRDVHRSVHVAVNCGLTEAFQEAYDEEKKRNEADRPAD